MSGIPALLLAVPEEGRKVDHPKDVVPGRIDQVKATGDVQAQRAKRLASRRELVGHDQEQVARLAIEPGRDGLDLLWAQELGDRRSPTALGLQEGPYEPLGAVLLGQVGEHVQLGTG